MNRRPQSSISQAKVIAFHAPVHQAIVGDHNTIHIKETKKVVNKYPDGSVGADVFKYNYVSYLIGRYNEYKVAEVGETHMRYGAFGASLKRKFKIGQSGTIYNTPIARFEELVAHIKLKIDGTMLARMNRGKGQMKNYESFEEYKQKHS